MGDRPYPGHLPGNTGLPDTAACAPDDLLHQPVQRPHPHLLHHPGQRRVTQRRYPHQHQRPCPHRQGGEREGTSFAHGWRPSGASSWSCAPKWDGIHLGSNGNNLFNGWTHGTKANNGLAVSASWTSSSGWKKFTSQESNGAPKLAITWTGYGVGWPGGVTTVTQPTAAGQTTGCTSSGTLTTPYWTVPAGKLIWNSPYTWTGTASDGTTTTTIRNVGLSTAIPQPVITQHMAARPDGRAFDPQVGNYTTSAVDATVRTVGPELAVRRTYNSLDPRTALAFGAGWATRYDMRLVPDGDGSGGVVVTMPDGREVRFGKNPDGRFAPPIGRVATLTQNNDGTYTLLDKSGSRYDLATAGTLTKVTDATGQAQTLTYDGTGRLSTVTNTASGRALHFSWSGTAPGAHVASVGTDPVDGAAFTWTYTYTEDRLAAVCPPTGACTRYAYGDGSHYRSAVLDSGPTSYYRFGETDPADGAASEVDVNQGDDTGAYTGVTLGAAGALAGTGDTAVTFSGVSSGSVRLADNLLRSNTYLTVEAWFKTTGKGTIVGYTNKPLPTASTVYTPAIYVGGDGRLRGEFWNGAATPITSTGTVNDGHWHHVVLTGAGTTQTLYLDGAALGSLAGPIDHKSMTYVYAGNGFVSTSWPQSASTWAAFPFTGDIDEVAVYPRPLGLPAVQAHYALGQQTASQLTQVTLPSGAVAAAIAYNVGADRVDTYTDGNGGDWRLSVPQVTGSTAPSRQVTVTGPGDRQITYGFDPINNGRITAVGHGSAPDRTYAYDAGGFLSKVTDENGNATTYTHDARGNTLSTTTCRTAPPGCQTSYAVYFLNNANELDPRNDKVISLRDARSASPTDATYQTAYTDTAAGQVTTIKTPATADFQSGRTTRYAYTAGTEAADGGGTTPAGLLASVTTPRGETAAYAYTAAGDLARVTRPTGERIRFGYDAIGRTVSRTDITDTYPAGLTTAYTYTPLSQPASVTYPPMTDQVTAATHTRRDAFTYDGDGNLTRLASSDLTGDDAERDTVYE